MMKLEDSSNSNSGGMKYNFSFVKILKKPLKLFENLLSLGPFKG